MRLYFLQDKKGRLYLITALADTQVDLKGERACVAWCIILWLTQMHVIAYWVCINEQATERCII